MTLEERWEQFDDEYIKFDRIEKKRNQRPDLTRFNSFQKSGRNARWLSMLGTVITRGDSLSCLERGAMNSREMSEWLRNLNFFACPVAANKIDELAAEVERLRKELQELSQYAAGQYWQKAANLMYLLTNRVRGDLFDVSMRWDNVIAGGGFLFFVLPKERRRTNKMDPIFMEWADRDRLDGDHDELVDYWVEKVEKIYKVLIDSRPKG